MHHRAWGALLFAVLVLMPAGGAAQAPRVLRISVVVTDSQGHARPVPRYRLQISDNPATAAPRRVITSSEGVVDVRLAPGNYTVESEQPLAIDGKAYQWTVVVDMVTGRDATLDLTNANAEMVAASELPNVVTSSMDGHPSSLLARWQGSEVEIWTDIARGTGVLVDTSGLITADLQVVGAATSVEVQLSPSVKVTGVVIATDAARGLALVRIHPSIAAAAKVQPLECSQPAEAVAMRRMCEFIASVAEKVTSIAPPPDTLLPVEPLKPFPSSADAPSVAAPNPSLYRTSSSEFDIEFITPPRVRAARNAQTPVDFGHWSEYVRTTPPVLLIRVTPKFAEGFWTKVARGVAMTQGVAIPSIKRPKSNFARMRTLCGDVEVVPVHPFRLEHSLPDKGMLVEGLYAFGPSALSPECATVTLQLFSEKDPNKADTLVVDAKTIMYIWEDFAPHRTLR